MQSKYYFIDEVLFLPYDLVIRLTSLHEGEPDGLIGLPLTVTENSSTFSVRFSSVGGFRVINEPFNELKEPYEKVEPFLFRVIESDYLKKYSDSATNFISAISHDSEVQHFAVYGENFVIDVLCTESPVVKELKRQVD